MDTFAYITIITLIAGAGGTGLGGVVGALFKSDSNRTVSLLLSLAGGIMLSVVCLDLVTEAMESAQKVTTQAPLLVSVALIIGVAVVFGLNYLIDRKTEAEVEHTSSPDHPQTHDDLDELIHADHYNMHRSETLGSRMELFIAGVVMACAIALHNLPEGMVIGASYVGNDGLLAGGSGFIIAVVIGLHNIPEGMSVAVPLISGGMGRGRAILITALSGLPTIIGAVLGYFLGLLNPIWLSLALSFAGG
ncbi:MAG: ZIP family metal transporter, partial [Eggerthellales bacterium]|nr:ZIP family metal transporter [Eggerthellales bacterium]